MKILFLSDDFPPQSFGGAGFSTFYLARGLQKAGHHVFVIMTCRNKSEEGSSDYEGLKIYKVYADYHERWRAYLSLYNPQIIGKIGGIIKEVNPDVVHGHNIHRYLSFYCLKLAKKMGKNVFWTARDAMSFAYGKLATKSYLKEFNCKIGWLDHLKQARKRYNPLRNFLIRKYLRYADKIFAVSRALKEAMEANGIENVEVNYTGIDVADWKISAELVESFKKKHNLQDKKIVFFGGRISGYKGLEQISQAMAKVQQEIPEAVLLIAGRKACPPMPERSDGRREIGWLEGEELKAAYWASDAAVIPSIYLDPFPRSNLEAMACKRPVVGTLFGGTPEIVQDGVTGYVVNPFNTELMAAKIIDLLKNPEKARQFGERGCERVKKHFSLDSQVAEILSWYNKFK